MERMGWNVEEVERNRVVLERIVAFLVALAALADRVAGLPLPIRLPVLAILGRGEAVARALVTGLAHEIGVPYPAAALPAADEAGRLAARFRVLALMLGAILAWVLCLARSLPDVADGWFGSAGSWPTFVALQASPAPPRAPDTS
ncbi:MAG: hypothetical protein K5872_17430 [Rhizobiaceae bacterium]|nr:hypothetical protein [Rhizobiaceae bacterium]MCV0408007.1 hypothetical protein [Rhizobiaceae bacterium]